MQKQRSQPFLNSQRMAVPSTTRAPPSVSTAAAEPEPEPPSLPSPSSNSFATEAAAATLGYDPTLYQRPHPDDVAPGSTAKSKSKSKSKKTNKIIDNPEPTKDTKGNAAQDGSHCCFDPACQAVGARAECAQCHSAWYCGKACQRNDWKRHKKGCRAAVAASARAATRQREAREARGGQRDENEVCVICCGPPAEPVEVRGVRAPAAPE